MERLFYIHTLGGFFHLRRVLRRLRTGSSESGAGSRVTRTRRGEKARRERGTARAPAAMPDYIVVGAGLGGLPRGEPAGGGGLLGAFVPVFDIRAWFRT